MTKKENDGGKEGKTKGGRERAREGQTIVVKEKNENGREGGEIKEVRGYSGGLWLRRKRIQSVKKKTGWRGHSIQRAVLHCHGVTGERARELKRV